MREGVGELSKVGIAEPVVSQAVLDGVFEHVMGEDGSENHQPEASGVQEPTVVIGQDGPQGDHRCDDHGSEVTSLSDTSHPSVLAKPCDPQSHQGENGDNPRCPGREDFEPVGYVGNIARHETHPCSEESASLRSTGRPWPT